MAVVVLEASPSMQTRVGEALDGTVVLPHDHERQAADLVDDVIAGLGDLFFATCELPYAHPQPLALHVVPLA